MFTVPLQPQVAIVTPLLQKAGIVPGWRRSLPPTLEGPLMQTPSQPFARTLLATFAALSPVLAAAQNTPVNITNRLYPNNLVVSRSVYDNNAGNVTVGEILPPNCPPASGSCPAPAGAPYNGTYPAVFNNVLNDPSFGITSKIYLDQLTLTGQKINSVEVPNSDQGIPSSANHLVTSFSSKSELALNLSTDGKFLSFMGYVAPVNSVDVSNANTPLVIDPTNPDGQTPAYRAVARVGQDGAFGFTVTNAYSGNNGRAAILNSDADVFYTAGNAGNGNTPQPNGVVLGAGAQFVPFAPQSEQVQDPGLPTPLASFSVTQLGDKADKIGKDDNFRGMTIFNNVLYYTKGSGSNGVNTVYFVDTTGSACPGGIGLPAAGAKLPTAPLSYDPAALQTTGLPNNMCILAGFPSTPAKTATTVSFPFGLWFADANTLYVADEGDGYTGGADLYTHAAAQTTAGLQKWVFNASTKTWQMAYVLKNGLGIGVPYTVANYPAGNNPATKLPWAPATDGLRNITGLVGPGGAVAIWAVSSTVSGNGDTGADPNRLFVALDLLGNTDASVAARFPILQERAAQFGEVLRGVSLTPGTNPAAFRGLF
jgi:hypothetical protein